MSAAIGDPPSESIAAVVETTTTTTTEAPTTEAPTSEAPTTAAPTTATPITHVATTLASSSTIRELVNQSLVGLNRLTVADPAPQRPPYIREEYQPGGWSDFDGDCMSTRHEVLLASSRIEATLTADGCRVEAGEWIDPYTGEVLTTAAAATIDHAIPLAEAHRSGGWRWDLSTKERFANEESSG